MKILITGGGGYIGSVATYLFLGKGYKVVVVDNFTRGYRQPLKLLQKKYPGQLTFYNVDIQSQDLEKVFAKEKNIGIVVHYAAFCLVDESMKKPEKYFINNVYGSTRLLVAMEKFGVKKIIFSSTCAVYGEAEYVPIDEKHPLKPTNPYGESKKMVEEIINWHHRLKGFEYVILRYFNVCGASDDGLIGDSKNPSSLLVQNAVRGALKIAPFYLTFPTVKTKDGSPIRDYINVVDLNEAHLKAVEYLFKGGERGIFNLGTGTGNSVLEIINEVQKTLGVKIKLKKTTPRQGEYAKMIAAISKAKKVLGWQPKRTIAKSISSLVKWYQDHPHGWQ